MLLARGLLAIVLKLHRVSVIEERLEDLHDPTRVVIPPASVMEHHIVLDTCVGLVGVAKQITSS